ncbi:MAG: hypothetical protein R2751_17325 [Bacteroidales bacterium]
MGTTAAFSEVEREEGWMALELASNFGNVRMRIGKKGIPCLGTARWPCSTWK